MGRRAQTEADGETGEGIVKTIFPDKGFGFIHPDEGNDDIFFHQDAVEDGFAELTRNSRVAFTVIHGPRGLRATAVRRTE